MSYRSQVVIGIDLDKCKKLDEAIAKHNFTPDEVFVRDEDKKFYIWDNCAWDEMGSAVVDIESTLFSKDLYHRSRAMMRVGEMVDDIEEYGDTEKFNIRLSRKISVGNK